MNTQGIQQTPITASASTTPICCEYFMYYFKLNSEPKLGFLR
jgi:hypothetical protein